MTAPYVVVSGNIAAGKSSLVSRLASRLSIASKDERPEDNQWFPAASHDPRRWTMTSELTFLLRAVADARSLDGGGVQERAPREHIEVLARWQVGRATLSTDELSLLEECLAVMSDLFRSPDVILWLTASPEALIERVHKRRRNEELGLTVDDLIGLNNCYDQFFAKQHDCPIIRVDTERVDVRDDSVLAEIATTVRRMAA